MAAGAPNGLWAASVVATLCLSSMTFSQLPNEVRQICKCTCEGQFIYCKNVDSKICFYECKERCAAQVHTLNANGTCDDQYNCTCLMNDEHNLVCARSKDPHADLRDLVFQNPRHLHCHNLCFDDEFEYMYDGMCQKERKWFPDLIESVLNKKHRWNKEKKAAFELVTEVPELHFGGQEANNSADPDRLQPLSTTDIDMEEEQPTTTDSSASPEMHEWPTDLV